MARLTAVLALLLTAALAGCDSGEPLDALCAPAASVSLDDPRQGASLAVALEGDCRVVAGSALAAPSEYLFGPDRDFERRPTFLISARGAVEDGPHVRLGIDGPVPPAPGRYPVMDLRDTNGRFGPLPARFSPDSVYSFTSNEAGQGYWFATGGEVVVERSDGEAVAGTFTATYHHGGGGRPLTVRGRFHAVHGDAGTYGLYSNPHGG